MADTARRSSGRIIRRERVVDAVRTFHPQRDGGENGRRDADGRGGASVTVFRAPDGAVDRLEIHCRCGERLTVYLDPEEGQG